MNNPLRNETPNGGPHKIFQLPPSGPKLLGAIPRILPHERVFPIQIGCDLFKLSGASLSSDGMSSSILGSLCAFIGEGEFVQS